MLQFRPGLSDLPRLKKPFGRLIPGEPNTTMLELQKLVKEKPPSRISAVGDVVSRETLARGIHVDLRIIDYKSLRLPTESLRIQHQKTYDVKNPAGVITSEAWDRIKEAMKERDIVIRVEGEEDLLTLPCIVESPDNALVLYGQPNEGLVVVQVDARRRKEARDILGRMIREESTLS